jgi:hypothetical protein
MSKLFQIGVVYPHEMQSGIGHIACTLGGINYESRGSKGIVKGSAARGASNPLFRHHFHMVLTDEQARRAKEWADRCVGLPYRWAKTPKVAPPPKAGGDCSGFMSGIYAMAVGEKVRRRFSTGTWRQQAKELGFTPGLGGNVLAKAAPIGVADRPYPGMPVGLNSPKHDHVRWIQARLNFALPGTPLEVDGEYGPITEKVVIAFQKKHGLQGQGMCGVKTWPLLNKIR